MPNPNDEPKYDPDSGRHEHLSSERLTVNALLLMLTGAMIVIVGLMIGVGAVLLTVHTMPAPPPWPTSPPPTEPSAKGIIHGTAFKGDLAHGLQGVTVTLTDTSGGNSPRTAPLTGNTGEYSFTMLSPATYEVSATPPNSEHICTGTTNPITVELSTAETAMINFCFQ